MFCALLLGHCGRCERSTFIGTQRKRERKKKEKKKLRRNWDFKANKNSDYKTLLPERVLFVPFVVSFVTPYIALCTITKPVLGGCYYLCCWNGCYSTVPTQKSAFSKHTDMVGERSLELFRFMMIEATVVGMDSLFDQLMDSAAQKRPSPFPT